MALQPTRFLVQHCLQPGTAEVREIVTASFAAVANEVLTNGGAHMAIEVAGLALEAYQPDFQDWIEATTLADLMASRKLRVVRLPERESAAPAVPFPQYVPPSRRTAPPPEMVPEVPPATPHAASTESTSVTIDVQDVLLAIGSLPRSEVPSCRNVVEHLIRHAKPSFATLVQSSLRRCGYSDSWEEEPPVPGQVSEAPTTHVAEAQLEPVERQANADVVVPTAAPVGRSDPRFGAPLLPSPLPAALPSITTFDLSLLLKIFGSSKTQSWDHIFRRLKETPEYRKSNATMKRKKSLLLHVAVEQGLLRGEGLKVQYDVHERYRLVDPCARCESARQLVHEIMAGAAPRIIPCSLLTLGEKKKVTEADLGFIKSLFKHKATLRINELKDVLKRGPGGRYQNKKRQRVVLSEAVELGLLQTGGVKNGKYFYDAYTLVDPSKQALEQIFSWPTQGMSSATERNRFSPLNAGECPRSPSSSPSSSDSEFDESGCDEMSEKRARDEPESHRDGNGDDLQQQRRRFH